MTTNLPTGTHQPRVAGSILAAATFSRHDAKSRAASGCVRARRPVRASTGASTVPATGRVYHASLPQVGGTIIVGRGCRWRPCARLPALRPTLLPASPSTSRPSQGDRLEAQRGAGPRPAAGVQDQVDEGRPRGRPGSRWRGCSARRIGAHHRTGHATGMLTGQRSWAAPPRPGTGWRAASRASRYPQH